MGDGRIPIAYLAPWVDLGGSDKGTIDWFRHIDRERWAPSLITTQPSPNRWLRQIEPYAEEIWELPDLMPGAAFPEFILGFLESRGVRLIHIMNSRLGFDLLPDIACLPEPPVVVAQMHAEEPDRSGYVRYAARRYGNLIDAFSVSSEQLKQAVVDYEIPPSRVEVIPTGVDCEAEFNPKLVEPLALNGNGAARILWPGRLVEQKDPLLTLEVLARARQRGLEATLHVVGDGPLEKEAKRHAARLGVADLIEWNPPSREMARWYRSVDLTLMTSTFEGVPYVIYESLAMGIPVVAPALPGNLELMDDDSGVLVEPRDDVGLYVEAIAGLLENGDRRRTMGARSRRRMLEGFSLGEMGRGHNRLYERLLAAHQGGGRWRGDGGGEEDSGKSRSAGTAPPRIELAREPLPERSIGVIVPCYRHGIFLADCIASIEAQTLAPTQVVVVDDGSEDPETLAALERLEADPGLTIVRQERNRGPSAARNRALAELRTSYVLPIDADDQLLPDALERMLAQLESAPEDVGFVYPHAQHFGNRSDFVHMPAYNLWLLMAENYCPAPALFDRRVFEAGIAYPEDVVVGHEDWDLILQLAERGVQGVHADGPTFLYRRQGFSRINAVNFSPESFQRSVERRHPALYGNRDAIKAEWAPALSIVLLDEERQRWRVEDLRDRPGQTCRDFELLARERGPGVRTVTPSGAAAAWLQEALRQARGRWVCVLTPPAAGLLRMPSFVEQALYAFWAHGPVSAVVLGDAPEIERHSFAQLDDSERLDAMPAGIVFERPPETDLPKIDIGAEGGLLVDLALGLQTNGPVQWRVAPISGDAGNRTAAAGPPGRPDSQGSAGALDLNYGPPADRPAARAIQSVSWEAPRLPGPRPGTARRWDESVGWTPPETQPLCRHVSLVNGRRIVTNDRRPPPGFALEFDLGVVHVLAMPGTRRLIARSNRFELTDDQGELREGWSCHGYIEQAPLPLLEPLELRRTPEGEEVLSGGGEDPLLALADAVCTLGWIEPFPIPPRGKVLHTGPWAGLSVLRREVELSSWRHRYRTGPADARSGGAVLGSLHRYPGRDLIALKRRADGRLISDLAQPGRASRDPRKIGAWVVAPLGWNGDGPPEGSHGIASARLRHLARRYGDRRRSGDEGEVIGWLRREETPGCSPLISSTHPITGDQYVTCSAEEAIGLGFLPDGILGYILDASAARSAGAARPIPWAHVPAQALDEILR